MKLLLAKQPYNYKHVGLFPYTKVHIECPALSRGVWRVTCLFSDVYEQIRDRNQPFRVCYVRSVIQLARTVSAKSAELGGDEDNANR